MVGVVLDTLQQIESHLMMHHYDGLMKDGKIKGRTTGRRLLTTLNTAFPRRWRETTIYENNR